MSFYRTRYNRRRGIARSSDRLVKNTSLTLTQILDDVIGYSGGGGGSGSGVIVVIDDQRGSTTPPASPATGDKYVVPCGATGAWASQDGKIAEYTGSVWSFTTPTEGMLVWVQKYDTYIAYITANATDTNSQFQTLSGSVSTWIPLSARSLTILPVTSQITTPPGSPAIYAAYIVDPAGTGAWTGGDNHIAIRVCASGAGAWVFIPPQEGMMVYDLNLSAYYVYDGSAWVLFTDQIVNAEMVQDWVDAAFQAGTHDGLTITYNDSTDSWDFAIDDEYVQDLMAVTLAAGTDISVSYNDAANMITIAYTGGGGGGGGGGSAVPIMVLDKDLSTPPGSPSDGDAYIVGSSPTGDWAGQAGNIAEWDAGGGSWTFYTADDGRLVWVTDENKLYIYNASAWQAWDVLIQTSVLEEWVEDVVNGLLVAGTGISLNYNDAGNTLTITNSGLTSVPSSVVQSSSANKKLESGIAATNASSQISVTFSNAFTGIPAVTFGAPHIGGTQYICVYDSVTTSGFTATVYRFHSSGWLLSGPSVNIHWHAAGTDTSP